MINFCKKSVHSLFTNIITSATLTSQYEDSIPADHHHNPMQSGGAGLSILTNYDDVPKPNNVIESSSLMINGSRKINEAIAPVIIKEAIAPEIIKQDRIEIKTRGLGGGDADGLASCTESLGFESCTERSMSNEFDHHYEKTRVRVKKKPKKEKIDRRMKVFPPPLKTLNDNGKPVFILKPVRNDGRLELTVVQIHRKESLRAFRENGRLRMHLVELNRGNDRDVNVGTKEEAKSGDTKDEKVVEEDWKLPENCSGGEDCRWLNEMVVSHGHHHHHHHHNMHGWEQQCVTIRRGELGDGSVEKMEEDDECIRIESIKRQRVRS